MKMKRNSGLRRGLTLLELMIVLVILVGIIALVGPRVLGTQKKADIRTAQAQIGNLESALKMFAVDMKTFPTTEEGLKLLVEAPEDEALAKNWDGLTSKVANCPKILGAAILNTNTKRNPPKKARKQRKEQRPFLGSFRSAPIESETRVTMLATLPKRMNPKPKRPAAAVNPSAPISHLWILYQPSNQRLRRV